MRHITTHEFVQDLPRLRRLDLFELANVESLWLIADHPSIEYLMFGRIRDRDLEPLTILPNLRFFLSGDPRWKDDGYPAPHLNDFSDEHPWVRKWHSLEP
jgi:hypothetical protein